MRGRTGSGLSEEESNGSYSEILMQEERRRERQRRREGREDRKNRSPGKKSPQELVGENLTGEEREIVDKRKERKEKVKEQAVETDIRARKGNKHSDSMDTLFSIPEDASFEQSPTKAESDMKTRQKRQRHVIDPLMMKLRDKIKLQRVKIDKERRKELARLQKLKKLEMLLNAKQKGKLSDKAIGVELEDVSTTSCVNSEVSDSTLSANLSTGLESDGSLSTTLKESSIENQIRLQVKKYPETEFRSPKKKYVETESEESSDFRNIIVERLPEKKASKKDKKQKSEKKYKVDEYGNKIRKEKKQKKRNEVFGVKLSDSDMYNQVEQYLQYMTPERKGRYRDASTMYPSPINVSPPSRRRTRDVLMKSEAIQTSPAVRSTSPAHAYDEVPVAPVPYMSQRVSSNKSQRRRPSPSPTRGTQTSTSVAARRRSESPTTANARIQSRSPVDLTRSLGNRRSSRSPTGNRRKFSPTMTRKQAQSPIWKPERDMTTPPLNSMFTPEVDENVVPTKEGKKDSHNSHESKIYWFLLRKNK